MFEAVKLTDIANLTVAVVSLLVALIALRISKRVSAMSVSRSFVIQELYELYENMRERERNFSDDFGTAVVQLADNINHIRSYTLILEQAGFAEQLKILNDRCNSFSKLHTLLRNSDQSRIQERGDDLIELHKEMHRAYVDTINRIEPKLRSILTNPFDV